MNHFKSGDYNVICDATGQKFKRSECRFTWDNKLVNKNDWDPQHPQLFIHPRKERPGVKDARPRKAYYPSDTPPYDPTGGV